ncbi:hypothetical protein M378DRAFT_628576 [Amanita muscaria Koide BX008]|uniref:Uncharacterized protein n=1 Tax=Amanita muscaria (strain Koide BX008) TaxID=946122 RepID=A0A0C2WRA3_AMAMK|nr:hypothetical protein M378DRAFT_628576 [Amanita muscaria Koide BX008]
MTKRKHSDLTDEIMGIVNRLTALNNPQGTQIADQLRHFLPEWLSLSAMARERITKSAGEFTFAEVVRDFGLNYTHTTLSEQYIWRIEDSELGFEMTPCLRSLVENYTRNFDCSSEAVCRTAVDFILNLGMFDCNGNHVDPAAEMLRQKTPAPFDDIRIYGKVAFNHEVIPSTSPQRLSVSGRLDYGIGRTLSRAGSAEAQRRRRFQCLLVIIEAKAEGAVGMALPQLLVYLVCLRHSRLERNRTDASVYGVSSDGLQFTFVTITHDGTVKISKQGDMSRVLGWLRFILEKTSLTVETRTMKRILMTPRLVLTIVTTRLHLKTRKTSSRPAIAPHKLYLPLTLTK